MRWRSLALAALLLWPAGAPAAPVLRGGVLEPSGPAPDFTLRDAGGRTFQLSRQRGRVVVIAFGYTFCPDVCPTTLAEFAQVKARLGAAEKLVRFVFITIDPERDTAERLRAYTAAFDRSFLGLTGTPAELEAVRRAWGVVARRQVVAGTAAAYLVDHSASIYVVDREGRLRVVFPFGTPVEDMTHDIKLLTEK